MKKLFFPIVMMFTSVLPIISQDSFLAGIDVSNVIVDSDPSTEAPSSRILMIDKTEENSLAFITSARLKPMEALVVNYGKNRSFYLVNHTSDRVQQFNYSFMDKVKNLGTRPVHYHVVQLTSAQLTEMKSTFRTEEIDNGNGMRGLIVKVK